LQIGILVPPEAQLLDVAGPLDVFREAVVQSGGRARYRPRIIAVTHDRQVRASGVPLVADISIFDPPPRLDTVIVAGTPKLRPALDNPDLMEWLRRQARSSRRIGSVCTGAFILGEAGVLRGRRVTTHWEHAASLAARFPEVDVQSDQIFVCDGPIWTSAGVTAGIDLALALVEADHGRDLALQISRHLVVFLKRPGGQAQFSAHLAAQVSEASPVGRVQTWLLDHLNEDLRVERLAREAAMSLRSFARAFLAETGATPADFVERARVEAACRRIEDSDDPPKAVARHVGFSGAVALRRAFIRRLGVSPRAYRERFTGSNRGA
jgi:transcriptional regulator GlxA family with amidase domain